MASYNRDRDIDTNSRDFEDAIYHYMREEIDRDYRDRAFDRDYRDIAIKVMERSLNEIANQCAGVFNSRYVYESEISDWANRIMRDFYNEVDNVLEEAERRDRRRDDRYRSSYDRGRSDYRGSRVSYRPGTVGRDTGSVLIGPGARRSNQEYRDDARRETPEERRSRLAKEGSVREREKDHRQATNQPEPTCEIPKEKDITTEQGITYTDHYAIIGNRDNEKSVVVDISPVSVTQPTNNSLYSVEKRENVVLNKSSIVDTRIFYAKCPMRSIRDVWNMIKYNDSSIMNAAHWCHHILYYRVNVYNTPGIGETVVDVMNKVRMVVEDKQSEPQIKLLNISVVLNEYPEEIRAIFAAKLLRNWNALAMTCFADPAKPNTYLAAATLDQLRSFYPDAAGNNDPATQAKLASLMSASKYKYQDRLNAAVRYAIAMTFEKKNGFVNMQDLNKLPYLAVFDSLPFVINKNKRPRDLGSMTEDEKKELAAAFTKDWVCTVDGQAAIITNMSAREYTTSKNVTCISATDLPIPQYFRATLDQGKSYLLYKTDPDAKDYIKYLGHLGLASDDDVMLVKHREE